MEVILARGSAKEIADLVVAIQSQQPQMSLDCSARLCPHVTKEKVMGISQDRLQPLLASAGGAEGKSPVLRTIKEIKEVRVKQLDDLKEATAMLATGKWIAIAAAEGNGEYLFSFGRV